METPKLIRIPLDVPADVNDIPEPTTPLVEISAPLDDDTFLPPTPEPNHLLEDDLSRTPTPEPRSTLLRSFVDSRPEMKMGTPVTKKLAPLHKPVSASVFELNRTVLCFFFLISFGFVCLSLITFLTL